MRTTFLNLILLFVIVGCKQPTINKVQQAVEAQTKLLVDSGLIANEYVVLYELAINDSNHIYSIQAADCPASFHISRKIGPQFRNIKICVPFPKQ